MRSAVIPLVLLTLSGCLMRETVKPISITDRRDPWKVECEDRRGGLVCMATQRAYGLPTEDWEDDKGQLSLVIRLSREGEWIGPFVYVNTQFVDNGDQVLSSDNPRIAAALRVDNGPPVILASDEAGKKVFRSVLDGHIARIDSTKAHPDHDDAALVNLAGVQGAYRELLAVAQEHGFDASLLREVEK